MDLFIRYFKNVTHQVSSRYLSSSFMAHSTTEDIIENLEASSETKMSSLLRKFQWVHPNVNWSILQKLTSNRHDLFNTTMLFLGSFGLHVINGALKTGHVTVKWKAQLLLRLF